MSFYSQCGGIGDISRMFLIVSRGFIKLFAVPKKAMKRIPQTVGVGTTEANCRNFWEEKQGK